jgi:hypothetical protein
MQKQNFQPGDKVKYLDEEWYIVGSKNGVNGFSYELSKVPPTIYAPENKLELISKRPPQTEEDLAAYHNRDCSGRVFLPFRHGQILGFVGKFILGDDKKSFRIFDNSTTMQPFPNEPPYLVENIVEIRISE